MRGVVKGMDTVMASMNVEKISSTMDQFEKHFEDLDVFIALHSLQDMEGAMSNGTSISTPVDQVDDLIQMVADENGLKVAGQLDSAGRAAPDATLASELVTDAGQLELLSRVQCDPVGSSLFGVDVEFELLSAWRREYGVRQRCEVTIHPRYASCACLVLSVYRHGDDMDYCVRQLAELLRLVELMTRIGVDPRALHQLVVRLDDCPMEQLSCSFCDDVDQRVVVELEPHHSWLGRPTEQSFFGVVRRAVFDWDDATATPAFHDLRDWLLMQASAKDAKRKRPIELHIEVAGVRTTEETELLLRQASDAASAVPFQLSTLRAFQPNHRTVQLMAASQLPVVTTDLDDWRAVREVEGANGPRVHLTALQANAYPRESEVESLYQLVQAHSSQLKKLSAFHGRVWNEGDDHEPQLLALARSLFAPDSPLHLDLLELMAPLGERELQFMLSQLGSTENARSARHSGAS
ncbi:hypothetical protein P43SY_005817 [Pythium insidiosum]|uniref:Uncharacterized protein n=1 Tax=Pythium insidiosum TaxID=114742 RepID=A0AAD5LUJ4_PYTIN|nr:hypothetical protein P43SY_005817 [Pythium insidiosum]